jgi:glyoxylase-like metal-dependent hydrolase (beta-lactamase superfamily II)
MSTYSTRGGWACWHSWTEQTASMQRLLDESFEWVLPGHGNPISLPRNAMHEQLRALVERMQE